MPTFKPKTTKNIKITKKNSTTLDGKHSEFVSEFNKDETDIIPKLKEEREKVKELIHQQQLNLTIEQLLDYKDQIQDITDQIKQLKMKKKEYYNNNSKYIFDYFENKQNISKKEEPTNKSKILDSFFKINTEPISNTITKSNNIFQKYLSNIDESFLDMNMFVKPTDICQGCFKGELISMEDEGVMICNQCSRNVPYLIENEKPSYKEPPKEVCFYAYKKINHFKEILSQFQGKETTQIPGDVIDYLRLQLKKERIKLENLTYYKTKELLKKLGYNKYYEHINFIKDKLGIRPPIISQELEETLCNFFMEIQYPYAKHCPDYRVNFLHYYYVLFKLFELLNEQQYLQEIPMLKDREKLIEQDIIWKKICEDLNWEFMPTI
jgi:hypothetical protein